MGEDRMAVAIGGTAVVIPVPWGYLEVSEWEPRIRTMAEAMTPADHRLLAVFTSAADLEAIARGDSQGLERYMLLQTERETEARAIGAVEFEARADAVRRRERVLLADVIERLGDGAERLSGTLSSQLAAEVDLEIGETSPLEIFLDTDRQFAIATLTTYRVAGEGRAFEYPVLGATSMIRVADRLLLMYVYATYHSGDDFHWVRKLTEIWGRDILEANGVEVAAAPAAPAAPPPRKWPFAWLAAAAVVLPLLGVVLWRRSVRGRR
jgi:hypothetical protein